MTELAAGHPSRSQRLASRSVDSPVSAAVGLTEVFDTNYNAAQGDAFIAYQSLSADRAVLLRPLPDIMAEQRSVLAMNLETVTCKADRRPGPRSYR
jgi:hypothetical protein